MPEGFSKNRLFQLLLLALIVLNSASVIATFAAEVVPQAAKTQAATTQAAKNAVGLNSAANVLMPEMPMMASPEAAPHTQSTVPGSQSYAPNPLGDARGAQSYAPDVPGSASHAQNNFPTSQVNGAYTHMAMPPTAQPLEQGPLPADQILMGSDSRAALQVLRSFKTSGWSSTETKIFVQGVDASTASGAQPGNSEAVSTEDSVSSARRKQMGFSETQASTMPQFLSFDQLSSAIDVSRLSILKEFHCVATYTRDFKCDNRQIYARVYVFSQPEGAYGAYYLLRQGASTVVQRGDGSSQDDQGISFWQGRLFVSLRGTSEDDDETNLIVSSLADKLSRSLKDHAGMPQIVNYLPFLMKVKGSERIVMGPLSARRFFPAPFVGSLDLRSCIAAAVADYQVQSPPDRLKLLYVLFPNPALALASYTAYTDSFEGHAVSFEPPATGESSMYKSNGTFVLCQQSGPRLTIIMGARKRASASLLANYLY